MSAQTPAVRMERDAAVEASTARAFVVPRLDILLTLALFALAIVPRAAWIAYNDRAPKGLNDPSLYMLFSEFIADGKGYIRPPADFPGAYSGPNDPNLASAGHAIAYYPVGFPATVGALKKAGDVFGWGRSTFSVKMMNGVFGAITVLLIYLLASRLFDRRVGTVAGALLAVFPSQVYYTGTVLSEPLFTMLWIAALLVLLWHPWDRDGMPWYRLLGAGLLLSCATMTRGVTLMFPFVLLAIWWFQLRSRKRALIQAAVVWAGIAVLVVPWSVRNTVAFGQLTGPSTNFGDDLCIGNYYGAQGAFTLQGKCYEGFEGKTPTEVELERNREGTRIAVHDVATHPLRMPKLIAQKAYWLLYKDDDGIWAAESYGNDYFIPAFRRQVLEFAANAIYYATAAVAIAGAAAFVLSKDVRRLVAMAALLYMLMIPLVFFGDPRFHFPAIPLVVVVAGATVVLLWDRRARRLPAMERLDARLG